MIGRPPPKNGIVHFDAWQIYPCTYRPYIHCILSAQLLFYYIVDDFECGSSLTSPAQLSVAATDSREVDTWRFLKNMSPEQLYHSEFFISNLTERLSKQAMMAGAQDPLLMVLSCTDSTKSTSTPAVSRVHALAEMVVPKSAINRSPHLRATIGVTKHQRLRIVSLVPELRIEILLKCMEGRYLQVSRDIHGRLRISNMPATAQTSKQLRRETLRAVFMYGAFVMQSNATTAQFERQLSSTIVRLPGKTLSTGIELLTKLNFSAFSHFPDNSVTSSLALASGCPNLRVLILNIDFQHMADSDWTSPNWFKSVDQLRNDDYLDSVFSNRRLQSLIFTGTGIGIEDYVFPGADDLAAFFRARYVAMQRTTEVLLETPPEEIWPEDEDDED